MILPSIQSNLQVPALPLEGVYSDRTGVSNTQLDSQASQVGSLPLFSGRAVVWEDADELEAATEGSADGERSLAGIHRHVDFYTGKFDLSPGEFESMMRFLQRGGMPIAHMGGLQAKLAKEIYENSFCTDCRTFRGGYTDYGDSLRSEHDTDDRGVKGFFCLSGGYWAKLDSLEQFILLKELRDTYRIKETRFDPSMIDYDRSTIKIGDIDAAVRADNYAGFQKWRLIESGERGVKKSAKTWYLGSEKSNSFGRAYEHDGYPKIELEMRGQKARAAIDKVIELVTGEYRDTIESEFQRAIGGLVVGAFRFCDRSAKTELTDKEVNLDRCENLPFWDKIIQAAGEVVTIRKSVEPEDKIQRNIRWIWRQVILPLMRLRKICSKTTLSYKTLMRVMAKRAKCRWKKDDDFVVESWLYRLKEVCGDTPTTEELLTHILGEDTNSRSYLEKEWLAA